MDFADKISNMDQIIEYKLDMVENIVGEKGRNFDYQHFLHFSSMFLEHCFLKVINFLPNQIFLDWSKMKAFADNKVNVAEKLRFILERRENIKGKGENAGYQHFLLFPHCFQMAFFQGC